MNEQIKSRRLALGLSQTQLAHAVSELEGLTRPLTYATVQQWESGATAPKHKRLQHVALALQTTVPELLGHDKEPNTTQKVSTWPFTSITAEQFAKLPRATKDHIETLICDAAGVPAPLDWRRTARSLATAMDMQLTTDHHTKFVIALEEYFEDMSSPTTGHHNSEAKTPARRNAP